MPNIAQIGRQEHTRMAHALQQVRDYADRQLDRHLAEGPVSLLDTMVNIIEILDGADGVTSALQRVRDHAECQIDRYIAQGRVSFLDAMVTIIELLDQVDGVAQQ